MEFIGTPLYMPPEAYGGSGLVDAHADVWALGVMLYETLAGEHPFAPAHDTPMGCMEAVLYRAPPSLAALGVVPPSVWMALRRAIAKPLAQPIALPVAPPVSQPAPLPIAAPLPYSSPPTAPLPSHPAALYASPPTAPLPSSPATLPISPPTLAPPRSMQGLGGAPLSAQTSRP